MEYRLTRHAREELKRRDIPLRLVEQVLESPDQIVDERRGRKVHQSRLEFGGGKLFLLRVVVNADVSPVVVITLYRTSKVKKYRRE